jgi:hypothetical protein
MFGGKFIFASISLTAVGKRFISTYKTNQPIPIVGKKILGLVCQKEKKQIDQLLGNYHRLKKKARQKIFMLE